MKRYCATVEKPFKSYYPLHSILLTGRLPIVERVLKRRLMGWDDDHEKTYYIARANVKGHGNVTVYGIQDGIQEGLDNEDQPPITWTLAVPPLVEIQNLIRLNANGCE